MLFAFDPRREAIFLVAGDKFGNWDNWYRKAVPLAGEPHAVEKYVSTSRSNFR